MWNKWNFIKFKFLLIISLKKKYHLKCMLYNKINLFNLNVKLIFIKNQSNIKKLSTYIHDISNLIMIICLIYA